MISAGDIRNGVTIEVDGQVMQVIEFQHVKPGKGAAFVRTKMRNIKNGGVVETSFRPTEKFPQAHIDRKEMQYLYNDGDLFNFMDVESYDQVALTADQIGDALKFVKENEIVKMLSHNGQIFSVEPPMFVELQIKSLVSRATQLLVLQSQQLLRQVQLFMFHFSLRMVRQSRLIPEQASTYQEFKR